jgi:DNA-binding SARP family transcriptional activator
VSSIRISLFGKLRVQWGEQVTDGLGARKVEELFCYLLLHRHHCYSRDVLADLFWDGNPTALAKKYLRKALWQLQASLEVQPNAPANSILLVDPDWIQVNPNADLWVDVEAFEEVYGRVQGLQVPDLDRQHIRELRDAVELYRGELLEGWYQDWCLYERERFQYIYLAMLDKLMHHCEIHHEYETGIAYGLRSLHCDRAQERTYRQLMRLHYLAGNRTAALRLYTRCLAALQEELGVQPAEETEALCAQIRADHLDALWVRPQQEQMYIAAMPNIPEPLEHLNHLKQFHAVLSDIQHWVQQCIEALELTLHR